MQAGDSLQVEFGLNWQGSESHDFSLVVWSTGDQVTTITADLTETPQSSHWPLTVMQEDDQNAAV